MSFDSEHDGETYHVPPVLETLEVAWNPRIYTLDDSGSCSVKEMEMPRKRTPSQSGSLLGIEPLLLLLPEAMKYVARMQVVLMPS